MTVDRRFVDLSHVIEDGMITYQGLPAPAITDFASRAESEQRYAPGVRFHIGRIDMVANTGTYIDSPFHRYEDGPDLSGLPLDSVAEVPAVVVRVSNRGDRAIGPEPFEGIELRDRAVLVNTGWDVYWRTERYFDGFPFLTADAANLLVDEGARLVGIDSVNIDDDQDGRRPVHSALLEAGIPVVEHLCHLDRLPDDGFDFSAVPVMVAGLGSFPVRAFAVVRGEEGR